MIKLLTIIGCVFLLMLSCKKDRKDDLEGKWQLREMVDNNGISHSVDTVWYNFQNTLFSYQIYHPAHNSYRQCYGIKSWEDDGQTLLKIRLLSDVQLVNDFLPYTDWPSGEQFFYVEKVSSKELILIREETKYFLRKF